MHTQGTLRSLWTAALMVATTAIVGCSGGQSGVIPGAALAGPAAATRLATDAVEKSASTPKPKPTPTPTPVPTPTPTPVPAVNASALPVQKDTNTSTQGVFLGEVCPGGSVVPCNDFGNAFRKSPALATTYTDWDENLGDYLSFLGASVMQSEGTAQEITWQPQSSTGVLTFAAINAGTWDAYMKAQALALKAYGQPVFLRPFHEFNGNWYPWGLVNQGASSATDTAFISAWQRMYTIFHNAGATNVKFIWCFATSSVPSVRLNPWNAPIESYPGDAYVDWIGFDAYNRGTIANPNMWHSFSETITNSYNEAISISPNKPIIISENASNEYGDNGTMKAQWIEQLASSLTSPTANNAFPHVRAISYFELNMGTYAYDSESTSQAFSAFVTGIRTMGPNGIPNFRGNGNAMATITAWNS